MLGMVQHFDRMCRYRRSYRYFFFFSYLPSPPLTLLCGTCFMNCRHCQRYKRRWNIDLTRKRETCNTVCNLVKQRSVHEQVRYAIDDHDTVHCCSLLHYIALHCVSKKTSHFVFRCNFNKYWPIFNFFHWYIVRKICNNAIIKCATTP